MIVYNYKGKKFQFWVNVNLLGNYRWFGDKPAHCKECMKDPDCVRSHGYYSDEVNVALVPLIQFGYRKSVKNYYFNVYWLIFDCGIYF